MRVRLALLLLPLAACTVADGSNEPNTAEPVTLRNLTSSEVARVPESRAFPLKGERVATPSDPATAYYLLRVRTAVTGNVIALLREERGPRIAYARTETDCRTARMRIAGVGDTRGRAETADAPEEALRPIEGLPLRVELATAICAHSGLPLART